MRLVRLLFIILFLLPVFDQPVAFGANEDLQSQDQITWYRAEFPPVTIPGGDNADTGFFDQAMYFLIEDLTQYHHQFRIANFKRIILEFKSGKNVCCPSLYKTKEREEFIAFSIPAMVVLPNGIIASEKSSIKLSKHIDENGKISLNSLLQDTDITLGISNGRIYSGGIDQIIQKFEGKSTILVRSGDDVFRGLMSMMYKGRVDVILGYPVEAEYFARKNDEYTSYVYYPVKESTVPFTVGYIGCTNNDWGKSIINTVNKIVDMNRENNFIGFYGGWLDEATREKHKVMAQDYFDSLSN